MNRKPPYYEHRPIFSIIQIKRSESRDWISNRKSIQYLRLFAIFRNAEASPPPRSFEVSLFGFNGSYQSHLKRGTFPITIIIKCYKENSKCLLTWEKSALTPTREIQVCTFISPHFLHDGIQWFPFWFQHPASHRLQLLDAERVKE